MIVEQARGITGRDDLWSHAGLLPNAATIKDPDKFIQEITIPDDLSGLEPWPYVQTQFKHSPNSSRQTISNLNLGIVI